MTVESHTAEWKRRDVLCSHDAWHASIEPKMSERWTVEDYLVALEDQLVGQYMRNDRATTGFLVLVLQKPRHWKFEGRWIEFPEVLSILTAKAQALEAANRSLNLRVIGIDATPPSSFRFDGAGAKRPSKAVASRKSRRRSTQR